MSSLRDLISLSQSQTQQFDSPDKKENQNGAGSSHSQQQSPSQTQTQTQDVTFSQNPYPRVLNPLVSSSSAPIPEENEDEWGSDEWDELSIDEGGPGVLEGASSSSANKMSKRKKLRKKKKKQPKAKPMFIPGLSATKKKNPHNAMHTVYHAEINEHYKSLYLCGDTEVAMQYQLQSTREGLKKRRAMRVSLSLSFRGLFLYFSILVVRYL